jgi:hypothetical protein
MKNINTKSILLSLAIGSSLFASSYEYPQLYKDTKIMGMGGANIAVGGQATSIFYNTAGIADIPKEYGWEVELLNINVAASQNLQDFIDDMDEANDDSKTDAQKTADTLDVTEKYLGKNLHISANVGAISVAKKFDKYAFSIVPLAGFYTNTKTHRGSGSAGILETQGLVYSGFALGVSKDIENQNILGYNLTNISLGVGLKSLQYKSMYANLSVSELIDDDLSDYFEDKYTQDGSSTVLDLGAKAEVYPDVIAGIAIQNIGSIASESAQNEIPMTVNLGVAYKHRFNRSYFNQYQIAFDYVDLFRSYSQDDDFIKRTRLGISGNAFDGWGGTLAIQLGLYEGHPTYGIDLRASVLKLSYTKYTEEIGAYSGQDKDTRHMFQLSLGW